ncbi:MAG TPA: universal stress protein [bacterium]|nr:universal stress protein [bacterium]
MFPFVFKLWRYHGLPTVDETPDVSKVSPVAPASPVASDRLARADTYRRQADLRRVWRENYLPRLWAGGRIVPGGGPRVILAVDDGGSSFEGALKTATFLADRWKAALAESPVVRSADETFRIAEDEGADWLVIGKPSAGEAEAGPASLAERLVRETGLTVLADREGSLANGVRRILIPVDGTASSLPAVAEGLRWARAFSAELMVLHVAEKAAERETEHADFLDILEAVGWNSVAHETRIGRGTVAEAILEAARDGGADLILMTTKRALIAAEVTRRSSVPVFVLHAAEVF